MQITKALSKELDALVVKYMDIAGDYESTLLKGMWHYLCDSGIFSDSWSKRDAVLIEQRVGDESDLYDNDASDEEVDAYFDAIFAMTDLDCIQLLNDIRNVCAKYNVHDEDVARELAERDGSFS